MLISCPQKTQCCDWLSLTLKFSDLKGLYSSQAGLMANLFLLSRHSTVDFSKILFASLWLLCCPSHNLVMKRGQPALRSREHGREDWRQQRANERRYRQMGSWLWVIGEGITWELKMGGEMQTSWVRPIVLHNVSGDPETLGRQHNGSTAVRLHHCCQSLSQNQISNPIKETVYSLMVTVCSQLPVPWSIRTAIHSQVAAICSRLATHFFGR